MTHYISQIISTIQITVNISLFFRIKKQNKTKGLHIGLLNSVHLDNVEFGKQVAICQGKAVTIQEET